MSDGVVDMRVQDEWGGRTLGGGRVWGASVCVCVWCNFKLEIDSYRDDDSVRRIKMDAL